MFFWSEIKRLKNDMEQFLGCERHPAGEEAEFKPLKKEILAVLKTKYGEASREFRVVKLSASPATAGKVLNHILRRNEDVETNRMAAC